MNIFQTVAEAKVVEIVADSLLALGYELVRVKIFKSKNTSTLQLMLDRVDTKPITINDCELASRHVSVLLDKENFMRGECDLEVSSPGLDRPLTRVKDFIAAKGKEVKLSTTLPQAGRKNFVGILQDADDEKVKIVDRDNQAEFLMLYTDIAEAKLIGQVEALLQKKSPAQKKKNNRIGEKVDG